MYDSEPALSLCLALFLSVDRSDALSITFSLDASDLMQSTDGIVKVGTLGKDDLGGPLRLRNINDLQNRIDDNDYYVVATSAQYPGGEIRGQVQPS
jgi:hypothetical protein